MDHLPTSIVYQAKLSTARRWNVAAVLIAAMSAAAVSFLPLATHTASFGGSGSAGEITTHVSLVSWQGPHVIAIALVPSFVAAIPLAFRSHPVERRVRIGATVLLGILVVLGAASIGFAFVPTLIMMVMALAATPLVPTNRLSQPRASLDP